MFSRQQPLPLSVSRRRRRHQKTAFAAILWKILSVQTVATGHFMGYENSIDTLVGRDGEVSYSAKKCRRRPSRSARPVASWVHRFVSDSPRIVHLKKFALLSTHEKILSEPALRLTRRNPGASKQSQRYMTRNDEMDSNCHEGRIEDAQEDYDGSTLDRRTLLKQLIATGVFAVTMPQDTMAAKPELDSKTGQLYSPRAAMLGGGGSDAARGIRLQPKSRSRRQRRDGAENDPDDVNDDEGETESTPFPAAPIYETRFIAYLSRFLLTFDPAARSWWLEQAEMDATKSSSTQKPPEGRTSGLTENEKRRFAEFAESVEIGLADYFVGPYGSYASVEAAKAGINARQSVSSRKSSVDGARQGILNLFALLKARYTSRDAKYQLAILFSLISSPQLQPTAEITSLLGEADNAAIGGIVLRKPSSASAQMRLSSRVGGGYTEEAPPRVTIAAPPALGDQYVPAKIAPVMTCTSRVLRVRVLDGGEGYTSSPTVTLRQPGGGVKRTCDCCAVLDRDGRVASIIVLDPGFGYGMNNEVPTVVIGKPQEGRKSKNGKGPSMPRAKRTAVAVADLEYEVSAIEVSDGGNGYLVDQPPKVEMSLPEEDPDWFLDVTDGDSQRQIDHTSSTGSFLHAEVSFMILSDGKSALVESTGGATADRNNPSLLDAVTLENIRSDPLSILPSSVRPVLVTSEEGEEKYTLPSVPAFRDVLIPSPRYRAFDPLFGGVGTKPVTVGAKSLSLSEYTRLTLSGAVCVVVVRTILNPLELVKTKIQLENDSELEAFVRAKEERREPQNGLRKGQRIRSRDDSTVIAFQEHDGPETPGGEQAVEQPAVNSEHRNAAQEEAPEAAIGTMDYLSSMVELRGPLALAQSADITFLSSLVFGSFGFGATELFRRSFSNFFFSTSTTSSGSEIVLLIAAALATVVTSAAVAPLETLRVRSMGLVESVGWKTVLGMYLAENKSKKGIDRQSEDDIISDAHASARLLDSSHFRLRDIRTEDLGPLWRGFGAVLSRELPFAVVKFLAFDTVASATVSVVNSKMGTLDPVQIGVGAKGLAVSAFAGALAGIAGAIISHPADLVLTLTASPTTSEGDTEDETNEGIDWRQIVQELISREGGIANLFIGLPARAAFFFFVIGLQFFLYDFVKNLFQVSSEDLSLILDVFYAVRQGLVNN